MKKEDKEFLKELQHEMLTQDTVCQADPRFWVVMQTVRDYWVDDNVDGICIYDKDSTEIIFEDELEELSDWLKENFDGIVKCEYDGISVEIVCEDENEYFISSMSSIKYSFPSSQIISTEMPSYSHLTISSKFSFNQSGNSSNSPSNTLSDPSLS